MGWKNNVTMWEDNVVYNLSRVYIELADYPAYLMKEL